MLIHESLRAMLEAEGLVIVPKEPTDAMMKAAQATNNSYTLDKWRAMLAAAPKS